MNKDDELWLQNCIDNPGKYKIWVDNDNACVDDLESDEAVHTFENYGYELVLDLFNFLGCNADLV